MSERLKQYWAMKQASLKEGEASTALASLGQHIAAAGIGGLVGLGLGDMADRAVGAGGHIRRGATTAGVVAASLLYLSAMKKRDIAAQKAAPLSKAERERLRKTPFLDKLFTIGGPEYMMRQVHQKDTDHKTFGDYVKGLK
jgi:hypothetical protein